MRYLPFVEEVPFKGWDGVYLSNGLIKAVCVPEIGGRLMQFSLGPQDYLFMNPELLGRALQLRGTCRRWRARELEELWRRQDLALAARLGWRRVNGPDRLIPCSIPGQIRI